MAVHDEVIDLPIDGSPKYVLGLTKERIATVR